MISKNKISFIGFIVFSVVLVFAFQNCSDGPDISETGGSSIKSLNPVTPDDGEVDSDESSGSVATPTTLPSTPGPMVLPGTPSAPNNASKFLAETRVTDSNYSRYTVDVDLIIDDKDLGKKGFVFVRVVFPENSNGMFYANAAGQLVEAYSNVPAFRTYGSLQKKYSFNSILNKINLFGEGKDQTGNQGAIMYIGYGFGDTTDEGVAEMITANRYVVADRIMGIRPYTLGTLNSFKLTAEIMPGFLHTKSNVSVFIGALTTEGEWFFLADSSQPWISVGTDVSKATSAFNGVITSYKLIDIVPQGTDISGLKGVRVYMGYGVGTNPIEEMVLNDRFLKIYEVP
jgi:hypothetical protein